MKLSNITIGSDPEYAAFDQNGVPRSVVGLFPGTKKKPFPMNEFTSCQVDNVGAEFCIPPCSTEDEFVKFMTMAKQLGQTVLNEKAPNLTLQSVSSARYSPQELDSDTARMFGCEPSYCVYGFEVSPRPSPEEVGNLRSFGCHIHVGFNTDDIPMVCVEQLIKAMDITLGLPSIMIDRDADRRQIYGNAGDLRYRRIKNVHIAEYRTLGGYMHSSEELLRYTYQQTMIAVDMVNNWLPEYDEIGQVVQNTINTGNLEQAYILCKKLNINIPSFVEIPELVQI